MIGLAYWLSLWVRRAALLAVLFVLGIGAPIAYTETACRSSGSARAATSPLGAAGRAWAALPGHVATRAEAGYAAAVAAGDPHDFAFLPPLRTYWNATCAAMGGGEAEGGLNGDARLALYGQGAAFTARMLTKAAYEETLGRAATLIRGEGRTPLDRLSAEQAGDFAAAAESGADWDYRAAADRLAEARGDSPRDWERMIALNLEYRSRGFFRTLVRLPALPSEPATLRVVVTGVEPAALAAIPAVAVVGPRGAGVQIETAPGEAATAPLMAIARAGGAITDIAGASEVLLLITSPAGAEPGALVRLDRPAGGVEQVLQVPVADLAPTLLRLDGAGAEVGRLLGN